MIEKHLFIINPEAGGVRKKCNELARSISEAAEACGVEYEIYFTTGPLDATEKVRHAAGSLRPLRVYACGGDGTLHETVNGVVGFSNVAICPVPVGSGNDFIRYFDSVEKECFLDLPSCIRGQEIPCDVLRCGSLYSLNSISAGLDSYTAKYQRKVKCFPLINGGFAYKLALVYAFLTSMKNPIRFRIDGEEVKIGDGSVSLAVVANGKWYGGGFQATPLAEINDGLIDFLTVPTLSRFEFLKYVGDYKKGDHLKTMPKVFYQKCKKIQLISSQPICMQADGEVFYGDNPEIEIIPSAIRLVIPFQKKEEPAFSASCASSEI